MKRLKTLTIGTSLGVLYAFIVMLIVQQVHQTVSIGYVFILPLILGAIPVLLSTKDQLKSYINFIITPWLSVISFSLLSLITGFEGIICLTIIIGPFLILGTIGGFIYRLIKLKSKGNNSKKLYISLALPLLFLFGETLITPSDHFETVTTKMIINAEQETVWNNIKNVTDIKEDEIQPHFIQMIGIPKPMNGQLDKEGVGGTRNITWEKGLKFKETTTKWNDGFGFEYDILVNTDNLLPKTLDEHVMIGGRYFDVIKGSYNIVPINEYSHEVILTSTYRITSTVNFYGRYWTNFIVDDFQESILEIIKNRCEKSK